MADLDIDTALDWRGRTVVDREGEKIGTLKEIYLDDSERPHWGAVHTALFGLRQTLVPLDVAAAEGDRLRLPFDVEHVKRAPSVDPDVQVSGEEADRLYAHYGLVEQPAADDPAAVAASEADDAHERDDNAMTRSEEEVELGTRARPRERVRIRKYVVTDHVEKTVPVKREEVRLERDPGGDEAA